MSLIRKTLAWLFVKSNFRNHHAVGVPAVSGSDHEGGGPAKAAIFGYRTNVGAENPELDGGDDRPLSPNEPKDSSVGCQ